MKYTSILQTFKPDPILCGALAGPIAVTIYSGVEVTLEQKQPAQETDDIIKAKALSRFLPSCSEFGSLAEVTERMIRTPGIWERVLSLAESLEQDGSIGKDGEEVPCLPEPLKGWPDSHSAKLLRVELREEE